MQKTLGGVFLLPLSITLFTDVYIHTMAQINAIDLQYYLPSVI